MSDSSLSLLSILAAVRRLLSLAAAEPPRWRGAYLASAAWLLARAERRGCSAREALGLRGWLTDLSAGSQRLVA